MSDDETADDCPTKSQVRAKMEALLLSGSHTHHSKAIEQGGRHGLMFKVKESFAPPPLSRECRLQVEEHYDAVIAEDNRNNGPIRVVKSGPNAGKVWLRVRS